MPEFEYTTKSLSQTKKLGQKIASELSAGDVIALCGELGAGKTSLAQGIAQGLNVDKSAPVKSPTFTIVNRYDGKYTVYHIDFYRIRSNADFYLSGLEEYFSSDSVTIVEWADKHPEIIPGSAIWIHLKFIDPKTRNIKVCCNNRNGKERFNYDVL